MTSIALPKQTHQVIRNLVEALLDTGRFKVVEASYSAKSFGNIRIVVASPTLAVRYTRDRGDHMLELTLGADSYSITDVADLIENVVTEISRTTDEEIAFLVNHWPEIEIAFSEHARPETLTRLDRLGRQRLRRMFPGGIVD